MEVPARSSHESQYSGELMLWGYAGMLGVYMAAMGASHSPPGAPTTSYTVAMADIFLGWLASSAWFVRRWVRRRRSPSSARTQEAVCRPLRPSLLGLKSLTEVSSCGLAYLDRLLH